MKGLLDVCHLVVQPHRYWQPHHGLRQQASGGDWEWESLDEDPQFLLCRHLPLPGWHMVELDLEHDQHSVAVRLYFDTGDGFSEDQSLALEHRSGGVTRRLIHVDGRLKRLRFDPMESPGHFAIRHFRIVWLTPWFARDLLSQQLVRWHPRWREVDPHHVVKLLKRRGRRDGCHWRVLAVAEYAEIIRQEDEQVPRLVVSSSSGDRPGSIPPVGNPRVEGSVVEEGAWAQRLLESVRLVVQPQRHWSPLRGVAKLYDEVDWEWESLDEDPQFLLCRHLPLPGWHMVELDLDHDQHSVAVRLYFDTGEGFSESESLTLPLKGGRITKRLIYVKRRLRRLRFDPMESPGYFAIRHFRVVWLSPWFAHDRLSQRLVNMHHRWRDVSKQEVLGVLRHRALQDGTCWRNLALSDYEETFERFCSGRSYVQWLRERGWDDSSNGGDKNSRVSTLEGGWRSRDRRAELDEIRGGLDGWRGKDERRRRLALQRRSAAVNDGIESAEAGVIAEVGAPRMDFKPVVSILLPVHDPAPEHLQECLESVLCQEYDRWQLCIVDDASRDPEIIDMLERFEACDPRVQRRRHERNGHICEASNTALGMASGAYIALLDHDDLLSPCALSYVVEALNRSPRPVLVYSDEDKVDQRGVRCEPHFKPCFNPDLLLAQNYMAHLSVFDTALVRQLGGFRKGLEGSQDHDLALRVCAHTEPDRIVHIPRILYHWRVSPGSTAMTSNAKDYTSRAGLRAVADHLARSSPGATVELGRLPNTYRVRWPLPDPLPLVSLMIPTRDRVDLLAPCVDAILSRTRYSRLEVLILDNGTRCEETLAYLAEIGKGDSRVRILAWNHRFNYSGINNFGAYHARGDVLGLVNNDIEPINEEWLEEMVRHVVRPDIGCVGAKLYYPNDTIQHAGVVLGIGGVAGHAHKYFSRHANGYFSRLALAQNYSAVTGACLLIRKALYRQVGGLNARDLPIAFNDVDLCLKVREAGYRNVWTPDAELYHHESESRGADDNASKRARAIGEVLYMRHTWGEQLDRDPAYNPNLTLVHEDFSLR